MLPVLALCFSQKRVTCGQNLKRAIGRRPSRSQDHKAPHILRAVREPVNGTCSVNRMVVPSSSTLLVKKRWRKLDQTLLCGHVAISYSQEEKNIASYFVVYKATKGSIKQARMLG